MSIGGRLDHRAYRLFAQKHRPADLRDAIAELASQGLKPADIARLLELSEEAVGAVLQLRPIATLHLPTSEEAAATHARTWKRHTSMRASSDSLRPPSPHALGSVAVPERNEAAEATLFSHLEPKI